MVDNGDYPPSHWKGKNWYTLPAAQKVKAWKRNEIYVHSKKQKSVASSGKSPRWTNGFEIECGEQIDSGNIVCGKHSRFEQAQKSCLDEEMKPQRMLWQEALEVESLSPLGADSFSGSGLEMPSLEDRSVNEQKLWSYDLIGTCAFCSRADCHMVRFPIDNQEYYLPECRWMEVAHLIPK
jgi:hypothetical protein